MIGHQTANSVANEIRMERQLHPGAFVLVEGTTDARFYKRFFKQRECRLIVTLEKDTTIDALRLLENDNFEGLLAIVDSDFWFLQDIKPPSQNLLLTDTHDLECLIIQSPALQKVLVEFGSERKIQKFIREKGIGVQEQLLEVGKIVGCLRFISSQEDLNLKFEDLDFSKFVSLDTLEIDIPKFVKAVKDNSQKHDLKKDMYIGKIEDLRKSLSDKYAWHICCGHDLTQILSIGFRKILGTRNAGEVRADILERSIRMAYESSYFSKTKLYASMVRWEKDNKPFEILSKEIMPWSP